MHRTQLATRSDYCNKKKIHKWNELVQTQSITTPEKNTRAHAGRHERWSDGDVGDNDSSSNGEGCQTTSLTMTMTSHRHFICNNKQ